MIRRTLIMNLNNIEVRNLILEIYISSVSNVHPTLSKVKNKNKLKL